MTKIPFFHETAEIFHTCDVPTKIQRIFSLYHQFFDKNVEFETNFVPTPTCIPGRPEKPQLVAPRFCQSRSYETLQGRIRLIHALAHIEFNAINLALDAVQRFQGLPSHYYADWLLVAKEEAYHFSLLRTHLNALGHDYGDFPAHDGLWEMAQKTAHDVLARMACVPRLLEARGLDIVPSMLNKFRHHGDCHSASLLEIIMRDEEKHVFIGNKWFYFFCEQRNLEPLPTFQQLLQEFGSTILKPPFALDARKRAGFREEDMQWFRDLSNV